MVTKGEIARFEQYLLLSPCFKKLSAAEASENVSIRKRVNEMYVHILAPEERHQTAKINPVYAYTNSLSA